jgi:hypothetical protein
MSDYNACIIKGRTVIPDCSTEKDAKAKAICEADAKSCAGCAGSAVDTASFNTCLVSKRPKP